MHILVQHNLVDHIQLLKKITYYLFFAQNIIPIVRNNPHVSNINVRKILGNIIVRIFIFQLNDTTVLKKTTQIDKWANLILLH